MLSAGWSPASGGISWAEIVHTLSPIAMHTDSEARASLLPLRTDRLLTPAGQHPSSCEALGVSIAGGVRPALRGGHTSGDDHGAYR